MKYRVISEVSIFSETSRKNALRLFKACEKDKNETGSSTAHSHKCTPQQANYQLLWIISLSISRYFLICYRSKNLSQSIRSNNMFSLQQRYLIDEKSNWIYPQQQLGSFIQKASQMWRFHKWHCCCLCVCAIYSSYVAQHKSKLFLNVMAFRSIVDNFAVQQTKNRQRTTKQTNAKHDFNADDYLLLPFLIISFL